MSNFFKTLKIMAFHILTFDFYLRKERQLKAIAYMNASTS